jgi:hypothetical protein
MTIRWLIPCLLVGVAACGGASNNPGDPPPDAGVPITPDAAPDAAPDAPPVPDTVTPSAPTLDLGAAPAGTAVQATVVITNGGTAAVTLDATQFVVSAPFALGGTDCPASLAAGASCHVTVTLAPGTFGQLTGTLTIPSSANPVHVELRATAEFEISLSTTGDDAATVTSDPAGLGCVVPSDCQGMFSTQVTLTATPSPGNLFVGWQPACGDGGPTCVVPLPARSESDLVLIKAMFAPAPPAHHRITVDLAGDTLGEIFIEGGTPSQCMTSPCVFDVLDGADITLWGFSPSQFAGWTGDCVSATHDCEVFSVTADLVAQATFHRDDREQISFFFDRTPFGVAFAPDGGLYIGADGLRKMRLDGTIEWRNPLAAVHELAVDAAGNVYAAVGFGNNGAGNAVCAVSPTGEIRWTKPLDLALNFRQSLQSLIQVSSDGTVIAVHTADGARVLDGDGNDRFAITGVTGGDGFALAADGTLAIGVPAAAANRRDVRRWTKDGTPLPTLTSLAGNFDVSLAFDAGDALAAVTLGAGGQAVSRTRPDLTQVFRTNAATGFSSQDPSGVIGVNSAGEIVVVRSTDPSVLTGGLHLDVFSPTGSKTFTIDKPLVEPIGPIGFDGVLIEAAAIDPRSHRVAVAGRYAAAVPWLEVFDLAAP